MTKLFTILFLLPCFFAFNQEVCDNGVDDDGDGLIDLNDTTDCFCGGIVYDSISIIQSLIPNSSFEEYNCCPSGFSQMSCSNDWVQVSSPTSDYYNICGFTGMSNTCLPYPHGNGVVGMIFVKDYFAPSWNYLEYVGTCLSTPLLSGTEYTIQFYVTAKNTTDAAWCAGPIDFGAIDLTIFGNQNCIFNLTTDNCPPSSLGWEEIGSVNYTPTDLWTVVSFSFTPSFDIYGFTIGSPCDLPPSYSQYPYCLPYFVFDGMILTKHTEHVISIQTDINLCDQTGNLIASSDTLGGTWQWYFNGIAIENATDSILDFDMYSYGAGSYTVTYTLTEGCYGTTYVISDQSLPSSSSSVIACESYNWPVNDITYMQSGTYYETISSSNSCDSVVVLDLQIITETSTLIDTTICSIGTFDFFGDILNQSGIYQHTLESVYGCDSTITLELNIVENWGTPMIIVNYPICPEDKILLSGTFPQGSTITWSGPTVNSWHDAQINLNIEDIGTYLVSYELNGCSSEVETLHIDESNFPFFSSNKPNVITPNNDNINDLIDFNEIVNGCEFHVDIINRWGNVIFHQNNFSDPFKGLSSNGEELETGVYFYTLTIQDFIYHGFIHITRN